jgi:hypothetical protein
MAVIKWLVFSWRDLCDDFSVGAFVLGVGMTNDMAGAPHDA